MKTIEEASLECGKAIIESWMPQAHMPQLNIGFDNNQIIEFFKPVFQKGVEFAERWIPVEEEMPTFKNGFVLIRCRNKNKKDGIWLHDFCYIDECTNRWGTRYHTWETITHWRPINHL